MHYFFCGKSENLLILSFKKCDNLSARFADQPHAHAYRFCHSHHVEWSCFALLILTIFLFTLIFALIIWEVL